MAVWIKYKDKPGKTIELYPGFFSETVGPENGTYISEEEYAKIPYPVIYLEYDKYKTSLRHYYKETSVVFGREEANGKVTVFINGEEIEVLNKKSEFVEKYFVEAL